MYGQWVKIFDTEITGTFFIKFGLNRQRDLDFMEFLILCETFLSTLERAIRQVSY